MIPSPYPKSTRWLVIAPTLFLLVFLAVPTAVIVQRGTSVDAFADIIANDGFRKVAWFTLWQTTLSTVLTVACALPVTFILARFSFIGKRLLLGAREGSQLEWMQSLRAHSTHLGTLAKEGTGHRLLGL